MRSTPEKQLFQRKINIAVVLFFAVLICVLSLAIEGLSTIALVGNFGLAFALVVYITAYAYGSTPVWMGYGIGVVTSGYLFVLVFFSDSDYGMIASFLVLPSFAFLCYPPISASIWSGFFLVSLVYALYTPHIIPEEMIAPSIRHAFVGAYLLQMGISGIAKYMGAYHKRRLVKARERIKRLEQFLSMCMYCRKVKHGEEWVVVEKYLKSQDETTVSHGICPECYDSEMQDLQTV